MNFFSKKYVLLASLSLAFSGALLASISARESTSLIIDLAELTELKRDEVLATLDDGNALVRLGNAYSSGNGAVPRDLRAAFLLYQKAANLKHAGGQLALAKCYYFGNGVTQDYAMAFNWAEQAAIQELPEAEEFVGCMYRDGLGVLKNAEKAIEWVKRAADRGLESAKDTLAGIAKHVEFVAAV